MRWLWTLLCLSVLQAARSEDYANNTSIQLFQQYVQINTTTNNDLTPAVEFWTTQAADAGVEMTVLNFTEGYPVIVLKWPGTNSSLSSIMLNSHMDVVPASESDGWTYPPFSAYLDDEGVIWGRGTQDMKSVSIQYLEALKKLKADNVTLLRDVYMTLMPDEETGAANGMQLFVKSDEFAAMNVGLELDEGTSYALPYGAIFYQDKSPWQIQIDCYGTSTHSSQFPATNNTATGMCRNVINKFLEFRDAEYVKYQAVGILNAGNYTSVNLNKLNGGTANNIIPSHVSLVFDIRLNITINETLFEAQLNEWITEAAAGGNVTLTFLQKDAQTPATVITADNPYYTTFVSVCQQQNLTVVPLVPPGATDARYIRAAGYPAFGFSPMPNTELLLHSPNERLNATTFLTGIDIYIALIKNLANLSGDEISADPSSYIVKTAG
ncbi:aminoacylase-1A-like [Pectinophora gossypiella]|uniref:aminoacylase-1A-like n=1 Tax=Pectinophora gossypiella TaxID=13191 RepID=UPI00214E1A50|nr:aminoacylase-1A-like [Pectinophora gossypiella]